MKCSSMLKPYAERFQQFQYKERYSLLWGSQKHSPLIVVFDRMGRFCNPVDTIWTEDGPANIMNASRYS
jgi:hypothetical protein